MKDLTNTNKFRNLKNKIKKHRAVDMIGGDIMLQLLEYVESLEGQILMLHNIVKRMKGEDSDDLD